MSSVMSESWREFMDKKWINKKRKWSFCQPEDHCEIVVGQQRAEKNNNVFIERHYMSTGRKYLHAKQYQRPFVSSEYLWSRELVDRAFGDLDGDASSFLWWCSSADCSWHLARSMALIDMAVKWNTHTQREKKVVLVTNILLQFVNLLTIKLDHRLKHVSSLLTREINFI